MSPGIIVLLIGLMLIVGVALFARVRRENGVTEDLPTPVFGSSDVDEIENAVVVAEGRGHLVFANPIARSWFGMNGEMPNLELLAQSVTPPDAFLSLFGQEGQSTFRVGLRRVEATSHYVPTAARPQMVVVMRDAVVEQNGTTPQPAVRDTRIAAVLREVASALHLNEALNTITQALEQVIPFDAVEVTLWDKERQVLVSSAQRGNMNLSEVFDTRENYGLDNSISGRLAQTRQSLLIHDFADHPDVKPKLENIPLKSFIGSPMIHPISNQLIGTIEMGSREKSAFDSADQALLEAVAAQSAVTIDNARRYEAEADRASESTVLKQIAASLSAASEPRTMYSQISEAVAEGLDAQIAGVWTFKTGSEMLVAQGTFYGLPDAVLPIMVLPADAASPITALLKQPDGYVTKNVRGDETFRQLGLSTVTDAIGLRSCMLIPLLDPLIDKPVGDKADARLDRLADSTRSAIGMLMVANKRSEDFNTADLRRGLAFAKEISVVIENARVLSASKARASEVSRLDQISEAVESLKEPSSVYEQIVTRLASVMNVTLCGIYIEDHILGRLIAVSPFLGVPPEVIAGFKIQMKNQTPLYHIYETLPYWYTNDAKHDKVIVESGLEQLADVLGVRQAMVAPLIIRDELGKEVRRVGVIQLGDKRDGSDYNDADANTVMEFASRAAAIIDNALAYADIQRRANESILLREITRITATEPDLDVMLAKVTDEVHRLMQVTIAAVALIDSHDGAMYIMPERISGAPATFTEPFKIDTYVPGFQYAPVMSRRPFRTANIRNDKRVLTPYREAAQALNFNAVAQVAIVSGGRGVGELTIANRDSRDFTDDDLRLMTAIALQIASGIERITSTGSSSDLELRIQQVDAINRVSNELNSTTEFERVLEIIRAEVQRSTRADGCTVVLLRPTPHVLLGGAGTETPDHQLVQQRFGLGKLGNTLAPLERLLVEMGTTVDVEDYSVSALQPVPENTRSAIAVPINYNEQLIGLIHVYSKTGNIVTDGVRIFIENLAQQASVAYGNAERFREQVERTNLLTQRAQQLKRIGEIGNLFRSASNIDEILTSVAESIVESVGFNQVQISIADNEAGVLRRVAQSGIPLNVWEQERQKTPKLELLDNFFKDRYLLSNSYFLPVEQITDWGSESIRPFLNTIDLNSGTVAENKWSSEDLFLVPLRSSSGELLGLISVDDPQNGRRPTVATAETMQIFANQAATALENYRLLQEKQSETATARDEATKLTQLHLVGSEIQRATDMPTRLRIIADGIREVGWGRVAITLRDADMEPIETITSGFTPDEERAFVSNLLTGSVWKGRLSDTSFRRYRVGQAYYIRQNDVIITENKRIAGVVTDLEASVEDTSGSSEDWDALDMVYLPIYGFNRARLIAIITMDRPADNKPPTETSLRPVELFASQAASAIENTRLFEDSSRAAQQEARINEVMEAVASTLREDEIIIGIARGLQESIAFTRMSVAVWDEDRGEFDVSDVAIDLRGAISLNPPTAVSPEGTAAEFVMQTGESLLVTGTVMPEYTDLRAWTDSGERTSLVVPMVTGGRTTGVLHMGSELEDAFGFREQMGLVARLANLAAVSIENARLFEQSLDRERFSASIGQIGRTISATLDAELSFNEICRVSLDALQVDGTYIWLIDDQGLLRGVSAAGVGALNFKEVVSATTGDSFEATVVADGRPHFVNDPGRGDNRWLASGIRTALASGVNNGANNTSQNGSDNASQSAVPIAYAMMGVPLERENKPIGILAFIRVDKRIKFGQRDLDKAVNMAAQVSLAIETSRQYNDARTREQQLSMLTDVSGQLAATLEPDAVITTLIDSLSQLLQFDRVTLWLRRGNSLVIRAARGYPDNSGLIGIEAEIADSELFREIALRGKALNIPDIRLDSRFPHIEDDRTRSWLGTSLVSRGELVGLLVLERQIVSFYTQTMEQLLLTFANQAAISLENARLFQDVRVAAEENEKLYQETSARARTLDQQTRRLSQLNEISNALTQSPDTENIFDVALRETSRVFSASRAVAMLIESEDTGRAQTFAFPRGDQPPAEDDVLIPDLNILRDLRRAMQPIIVTDTTADPRVEDIRSRLTREGIASVAYMPLQIGGQLLGVLTFASTGEDLSFTSEQMEIAGTIASQTAIAVQNANLFEQTVTRRRELETLFEAAQATTSTLNLDEVLDNTARQMTGALNMQTCTITFWNDVEDMLVVQLDMNAEGEPAADPIGKEYPVRDYPTRGSALDNRKLFLMRASDPNLSDAETELLKSRGAAARIILPLVTRDQAIGLIELDTSNPLREFAAGEVRLAQSLSAQTSISIDNARLQTDTAMKLSELFVINDLSTALASAIEPEQVFQIVRAQLPTLVNAPVWMLAVYGEDKFTISYPIAIRNGQPFEIPNHLLSDDEVSYVIKRRTPQRFAGSDIAEVLKSLKVSLRVVTSTKSFLGIPLIAGDEVIGALVLVNEEYPRPFDMDIQRVLTTASAQIAVSLQNARLFARTRQFAAELEQAVSDRTEELQSERDRIDFLFRLTGELSASLDTRMVLNRALEMLAEATGADSGEILAIDQFSENFLVRAALNREIGYDDTTLKLRKNEGLGGWVVQMKQSIIVDDAQHDPRWLRLSPIDDMPRSAIAVLLEVNDETLGVALLYNREPDTFTEAHLRLVSGSASQIATAMNNSTLYAMIREQAERLGMMVRKEQVDSIKNVAIVEAIADGVMVADAKGDITQFNNAAERILGVARIDVVGRHITELAELYASAGGKLWADEVREWSADSKRHQSGEILSVQIQLYNERFIAITLAPVNMGDQFLGTVSVIRDITREIEVDRMKSEFVSTVSHELRTPMTSIKGYADLLLIGAAGAVNDDQTRFLSTIKSNADRLSVLVNELLEISRIERGQINLKMSPTDVSEVIDSGARHLQNRITNEKKPMNIVTDVPADLPTARADHEKLVQIVTNLVDNAYNYTHANGTITISASAEPRHIMIAVRDTGVGIAPELQERIWSRFFRDEGQELVMNTSGTGLGLSIVRELVQMHEGEISVESEVGVGSTFYVRIPRFVVL